MNGYKTYLETHCSPSTADKYLRDITFYFQKVKQPKQATYSDIIHYLNDLRDQYTNNDTINRILCAIKKYYSYLLKTNQIQSNPAENIHLKNLRKRHIFKGELLTMDELQQLESINWPRKVTANRNKAILSLLLHQALTRQELVSLQTYHIDTENALVKVPETNKTAARELPLQSKQVMLLFNYQSIDRKQLLLRNNTKTESLFISLAGEPITEDVIKRLLNHAKKLFPHKKINCQTIRLSVIADMLKQGKDIRVVQTFAGHKYPSSTERYKQSNTDELQRLIDQYHPLNSAVSTKESL